MSTNKLATTRQETYDSLTLQQQHYLDFLVKRGRKTKWLNILAAFKGVAFTEEELASETPRLLDEVKWELIDVEDAGTISKALRCECGKALRFRYTVLNRDTGVLYKLGSEHLEQYTALDAQTVKAVVKGLKLIDLERDELLDKCHEGWLLPDPLRLQLRASIAPFSILSLQEILEKLQNGSLKEPEAKTLLCWMVYQKNDLLNHQYTPDLIKQIVNRSLGHYGTSKLPIRNILFDIVDL